MILVEGMSDLVRIGVTTGLPYIEIYSFFVASGNPIFLNISNSYLSYVGFSVSTLGIMYLIDNSPGDSGNYKMWKLLIGFQKGY